MSPTPAERCTTPVEECIPAEECTTPEDLSVSPGELLPGFEERCSALVKLRSTSITSSDEERPASEGSQAFQDFSTVSDIEYATSKESSPVFETLNRLDLYLLKCTSCKLILVYNDSTLI